MRTAIVFLTICSFCYADTIHVPGDQPTIQAGIDAAFSYWDRVIVAPGTYVENIDFLGKSVTVMSSDGPMVTVIDGGQPIDPDYGSVVIFQNDEIEDAVLTGFTITNGKGSLGLEKHLDGGGIFCYESSPTLTNNIIKANKLNLTYSHYGVGGGMFVYHGHPWIENCLFIENEAYYGGAMWNDSCKPFITNCTFVENYAAERGAGIHNYWALPQISGCKFDKNICDYRGGGIYNLDSWPTIVNSLFTGNQAAQGGGAVYALGSFSDSLILNCTIVRNLSGEGAGMEFFHCWPTLINCTFADNIAQNMGGALNLTESWPKLVNCILWGDIPNEISMNSTSDPNITHSCVQGGWTGTGNIDSDPHFVDGVENDMHILYTSPCKDTGDNSAVTELYDFEGDPRIAYGTVDMGADEFYTHLYYTGNATPNGDIQGKIVGFPTTWPVGLFLSAGQLDPPLQHIWGLFHLQPPFITIPLVPIPSNGILVLPATIPASPPAPYDVFMQVLVGGELSNLSVLEVR